MRKSFNSGFTLIELIAVIVILGILTATAMPKLSSLDTSAKTAAVQGGLSALQAAATIYYSTNRTSAPLISIIGQTTFTDSLFSIATGTCSKNYSSSTGSIVDGSYFTTGSISGGSTVLASTILDAALCSS